MISNKKRGVSDSDTPFFKRSEIEYDTFKYEKIAIIFLLFSADFFLVCPRTEKGDLQEFFPLELGS